MTREKARAMIDLLDGLPTPQLHPSLRRILVEIIEEISEFEEPAAEAYLHRGRRVQ